MSLSAPRDIPVLKRPHEDYPEAQVSLGSQGRLSGGVSLSRQRSSQVEDTSTCTIEIQSFHPSPQHKHLRNNNHDTIPFLVSYCYNIRHPRKNNLSKSQSRHYSLLSSAIARLYMRRCVSKAKASNISYFREAAGKQSIFPLGAHSFIRLFNRSEPQQKTCNPIEIVLDNPSNHCDNPPRTIHDNCSPRQCHHCISQ